MNNCKVTPLARSYAAERGWHVLSIYQPPWLFVPNGRKLTRCAESCDPWLVRLGSGSNYLFSERTCEGIGATPDDAVLAAVPRSVTESLRLCELAVDSLHGCLQKLLREENKEDRFDATLPSDLRDERI